MDKKSKMPRKKLGKELKKHSRHVILIKDCEVLDRTEDAALKEFYKAMEHLVWVTQLGFSLLFPLVCFLWLARWLVGSHGWPAWIWLPAILLGLATGAATFQSFAARWLRQSRRDAAHRPSGFDKH